MGSRAFAELLLVRQIVEMKLAAAEVERVGIAREFFAERLRKGVDALLSLLLDFEQAGFLEDAEVLGNVVRRDLQRFTQFGDWLRTTDERAHQTKTCRLSQRPHGGEAVE